MLYELMLYEIMLEAMRQAEPNLPKTKPNPRALKGRAERTS